jgi:hypothetical protein
MLKLDVKYSLKPKVYTYGNYKEFRSIEVIKNALPEFLLKPVLVLPDFSRFEQSNYSSKINPDDIAGNVSSFHNYEKLTGSLNLGVMIEKPEAIAKIEASSTKTPETRVYWMCQIEKSIPESQWQGEYYDWVQTKIMPIALVLKFAD